MRQVDLVVIGGGSAGLAAAISAYDSGVRSILLLEKDSQLGGILNQCIHNGFGLQYFKTELTGPEYASRFIHELKERNIEYKCDTFVMSVSPDKQIIYTNEQEGYVVVKAKSIIFACGCTERTRGAIQTPGYRPKGVYTAGLAQKYLNIDGYLVGKKVFILGSGDIGLIMARRMTLEGAQVLGVAEIMPYSNGLNRNIVQCLEDFNIPLYLSTTVTDIHGKQNLTGITIAEVDASRNVIPGTERDIECDTLLLSIGLVPYNGLFQTISTEIHPRTKGAKVDQNLETNIEGVFSCGNVLHVHDLVDYVTEEGIQAGKSAKYYLDGLLENRTGVMEVSPMEGVSYTLPSTIYYSTCLEDSIRLKFRSIKPFTKKPKIQIYFDDVLYKEYKRLTILPSLMEQIVLPKKDLGSVKKIAIKIVEEE